MYCQSCGHKNEKGTKFCKNCGATLLTESANNKDGDNHVKKSSQTTSKKNKKTFGVLIAVAVLLFGGFKWIESYYSFTNQLERHVAAVEKNDPKDLATYLSIDSDDIELTEESVTPFTRMLEEREDIKEILVARLSDVYTSERGLYGNVGDLYVKENGKYFGLFDKYSLFITPMEMNITSNYNGAKILVDDEEVGVYESESLITPLVLPGRYDVKGETDLNGELISSVVTTDISSSESSEVLIEMKITPPFTVKSNINGTVYLNDKKLGELTNGQAEFSPIVWNEGDTLYIRTSFSGEDIELSRKIEDDEDVYYFRYQTLDDTIFENELNDLFFRVSGLYNSHNERSLDYVAELLVDENKKNVLNLFTDMSEMYINDEEFAEVALLPEVIDVMVIDMNTYLVNFNLVTYPKYNREDTGYTAEDPIIEIYEAIMVGPSSKGRILMQSLEFIERVDQ